MAKLRSIFKKHLIPNLESKCRLCLSDKTIVQCIFQSENSQEVTDTLVEKIFECTAIMLSKDFDFPSPICEDCAFKLDEFLLFRTKCLRSNEIYRFNRLHKQRFFFGNNRANERKPPVDDSGGNGEKLDTELTTVTPAQEQLAEGTSGLEYTRDPLPLLTIAEVSGSSSSDSHTVIATDVACKVESTVQPSLSGREELWAVEEQELPSDTWEKPACNGDRTANAERGEEGEEGEELLVHWKPPALDDSEDTSRLSPAPVVLLVDETDTTVSESEEVEELVLPLSEAMTPDEAGDSSVAISVGDVTFPIETVEQLQQLERLIRASGDARERYINVLRQLKTHNTSLSETYQRLFADRLLIHYNYDGISPKYNKRPLKTLLLFTDCMAAAWEDHMDAVRVKDAVIEAVRKSHNRYNQYNHRKLRMVIAEDTALNGSGAHVRKKTATCIRCCNNSPERLLGMLL